MAKRRAVVMPGATPAAPRNISVASTVLYTRRLPTQLNVADKPTNKAAMTINHRRRRDIMDFGVPAVIALAL
jgi:hypothetical protein